MKPLIHLGPYMYDLDVKDLVVGLGWQLDFLGEKSRSDSKCFNQVTGRYDSVNVRRKVRI